VHWAEDTAQANGIVLDILRRHDAHDIVKGKSMVSEEMHLNHFLEENGIEAIETDLGEFIIQLNHETPSHIIVPAIHKNKDEVAAIFHEKIPDTPYTENVEELTAIARRVLRKRFAAAKVGLSGVNFAIAETGTLLLVENEGNGRMCTTVPEVHVAVMGLEKVIEKLSDVPPLLRLLTGSATGQTITTYVNMITSPRRTVKRTAPRRCTWSFWTTAVPACWPTRSCARPCCASAAAPASTTARFTFASAAMPTAMSIPGPIGKILTPQMEGSNRPVCWPPHPASAAPAVKCVRFEIPIPDLIRRLRNESYDQDGSAVVAGGGYKKNLAETLVWKGWELANRSPLLNGIGTRLAGKVGKQCPTSARSKNGRVFARRPKWPVQPARTRAQRRGER
jgi:L-lactate dehydrogenase complex protein LldF